MNASNILRKQKQQPVLFFALFSIMIVLVVLGLFGMLLLSKSIVAKSQRSSAEKNLRMYAAIVEDSTKSLSEMAAQVSNNSYVSDWANTSHIYTDRSGNRKILCNHQAIVTSTPLISSIDIYSANSEMVLSSHSGYYSVHSPAASGEMICQKFLEWGRERRFQGQMTYTSSKNPQQGLGTLVYMYYIANTGPQGVVAITAQVKEILLSSNAPEQLDIYVYNPEYGWVYPLKDCYNRVFAEALERYIQMEDTKRERLFHVYDQDYSILTVSVFEGSLYMVALLSDLTLNMMLQEYLLVAIILCWLVLVIIIMISRAMVRVAYKPIQQMVDTASEEKTRLSPRESIQQLEKIMSEYSKQKEALRCSMDINRQYLHERQVKDIVFGNYMAKKDMPVPAILNAGGQYGVLVVAATSNAENSVLGAFIEEVLPCVSARASEMLRIGRMSGLLLFSLDIDWTSDRLARLLEKEMATYAGEIVVGVSELSDLYSDIPLLYEQASMVVNTIRQWDGGFVSTYQDAIKRNGSSPEWMKMLSFVNALRTRTLEQVVWELRILFDQWTNLSPDEKQSGFLFMIYTIVRVYKEEGLECDVISFADVIELKTNAEQFNYIINLCEQFIIIREEYNQKHKRASIETAVQYLQLNFDKPISLNILADEMGISQSYLSELIKKELNMNYLNYVRKLRIERAKELLCKTDLPILDIGQAVGYDSVHSFIRNFKRIMNTTPAAYRMQLQKSSNGA